MNRWIALPNSISAWQPNTKLRWPQTIIIRSNWNENYLSATVRQSIGKICSWETGNLLCFFFSPWIFLFIFCSADKVACAVMPSNCVKKKTTEKQQFRRLPFDPRPNENDKFQSLLLFPTYFFFAFIMSLCVRSRRCAASHSTERRKTYEFKTKTVMFDRTERSEQQKAAAEKNCFEGY